ncbi:cell surface protein [Colletotrichum truncatum]|uniref:Cell surface protein n=1 Tax=Colletotrichum truncatum TaxID=5467 RepID=A0ACC3Z7M4_COLTU|nr:cell surface protein [Colletotrichum truncatum]KAF6782983.1 cell surface protein [Colletotrichum truncatum]
MIPRIPLLSMLHFEDSNEFRHIRTTSSQNQSAKMGLGQKIKDALHHDHPDKTYENDSPPGAFPSDTTHNKHNNMSDGRDYTTTGTAGTTGAKAGHTGTGLTGNNTTTGGTTGPVGSTGTTGTAAGHTGTGLTGKNTTAGTGHHISTTSPTNNTLGGATGDLTGTSRTGHRPTDSGVDVGRGPGHRKDVAGDLNRTGESGVAQDPYWGSMGRESHGVTGPTGTSGLTGSNVRTGHDDPAGTHGPHANRAGNLADPRVDSDRDHRGAPGSGLTGSNVRSGYDDPAGTHGLHGNRAGNLADPRVDSDRDHRGAPGVGMTGSNVRTGYDDPAGTHGPHANRAGNLADPRVDSDRDHRGAPHSVNKDLPLRPNENRGAYDSNITSSRGQGPEAVGGGRYNPLASAGGHHDPTSSVDRSIEGREFTHTGHGGNTGPGTGSQMQYGLQNPVNNPSLIGANNDDPYDTRMRDRDMGRDRTGHGLAGGAPGAALGVAASEASRRHHHDDIREAGYGGNNTGDYNSPTNTRGGIGGASGYGDHPRSGSGSGLTGHEPGVPKTSMLDPYNSKSPTHGVGANEGLTGGRDGSPTFNQGHEGAKVMHTCSHCGNDNDISRYFKKDAVYRMN